MRYSDQIIGWLCEAGYTHCFFVPGGNIMHLINSADQRMTCIGYVHEVAATIAAEYFNEISRDQKAFTLVTAGPGLTNALTGMVGAHLESRELLVIGGQVKVEDLAHGLIRQKGLQEVDGVAMAAPTTKLSVRLDRMVSRETFMEWISEAETGRKGCVFIEACLDIQGVPVSDPETADAPGPVPRTRLPQPTRQDLDQLSAMLAEAKRPVILLGGGISRRTAAEVLPDLERLGAPVMTSWTASDRIACDSPVYFGRPDNWGQRYANVLVNQADLLLALGTRLNLQQTGFNWRTFVARGRIVQVDLDPRELTKGHPNIALGLPVDGDAVLRVISKEHRQAGWDEWLDFCREVKGRLPLVEPVNSSKEGCISPHDFVTRLSTWTRPGDVVIPCSSGGANFVTMQAYEQQPGQLMVVDKSLASMGYGLSGAIGAALAYPDRRTVLVEGDGGFAQNLQELGTVAVNNLNMKIFIFDDSGYASIRGTQRNYFNGRYFGCDKATGLGLPNWVRLFEAYDIPAMRLTPDNLESEAFMQAFDAPGPAGFIVTLDPEQTYWPKITSRITESGSMESSPLHLMTPPLSDDVAEQVFRYLT